MGCRAELAQGHRCALPPGLSVGRQCLYRPPRNGTFGRQSFTFSLSFLIIGIQVGLDIAIAVLISKGLGLTATSPLD